MRAPFGEALSQPEELRKEGVFGDSGEEVELRKNLLSPQNAIGCIAAQLKDRDAGDPVIRELKLPSLPSLLPPGDEEPKGGIAADTGEFTVKAFLAAKRTEGGNRRYDAVPKALRDRISVPLGAGPRRRR